MTYRTHITAFTLQTRKRLDFITITDRIKEIIAEAGIDSGLVVVQTHHTTARLWVNEDEKNLVGNDKVVRLPDIHHVLDRFASPDEDWGHNDIKDANNPNGKRDTHLCAPDAKGVCHECLNGHAHAQALLLPHSVTFIVQDGKLLIGDWQEIMLVELDHDRQRTVSVLILGETK